MNLWEVGETGAYSFDVTIPIAFQGMWVDFSAHTIGQNPTGYLSLDFEISMEVDVAVPEPATATLAAVALGGALALRGRRPSVAARS